MRKLRRIVSDTAGTTAIEYGLIAALIAFAAVGSMSSLGSVLNTTFNKVAANMAN